MRKLTPQLILPFIDMLCSYAMAERIVKLEFCSKIVTYKLVSKTFEYSIKASQPAYEPQQLMQLMCLQAEYQHQKW